MSGYSITHVDDIPELESPGESPMRPVRQHFGISSFGINAFTAQAAGDQIINEHDEDEGREELYLVTRGSAVFELDGERRDAPAGTFVHVPPNVKRTATAEEAGTTIVVMGGIVGKAYEPVGWEAWYPLRKLHEAGDYEEVVARGPAEIAASPDSALLHFNVACCESLTGRTDDAIEHLGRAIELSGKFRDYAEGDSDFDAIRDEPGFKRLLES